MTADWYRNETWNAAIESDFLTRLGRSRTQRDQYLVIQALTLAKRESLAALKLVELYFESKKGDFHDVRALLARADARVSLSDVEGAIVTMKEILAIERLKPSQKTNTYTDFPFLVATRHIESEYDNALATLVERAADLAFPISHFKWHASKALIHYAREQTALSKEHAGLALDAAKIKKSGFTFHQNLGVVGSEHKNVIGELRAIYA